MREPLLKRPYRQLLLCLGLLVVTFLMLEGWLYYIKPTTVRPEDSIRETLDDATALFNRTEDTITGQTARLQTTLEQQLKRGAPKSALYRTIDQYESLWGITLFRDRSPYVWKGFAYSEFPFEQTPAPGSKKIEVRKENNVVLFLSRHSFSIPDSISSIPYHLVTTRRIEQKNALPIGRNSEFNLFEQHDSRLKYPVKYSIFTPLNSPPTYYRILKTADSDSVGIVYAEPGQFESLLTEWNSISIFWKAVFSVLSFLILSGLLYAWTGKLSTVKALSFQLLIIIIVWAGLHYLSVPGRWLPNLVDSQEYSNYASTYQLLSEFGVHGIFLFFLGYTLYNRLTDWKLSKMNYTWVPGTIFWNGLFGLFCTIVILGSIYVFYTFVVDLNLPVLDLQIFPDLGTVILYLVLGLLVLSAGFILYSIGLFLFQIQDQHHKIVSVVIGGAFMLGLLLSLPYVPPLLLSSWGILLAILYFLIIFLALILRTTPHSSFKYISPLRAIALLALSISLVGIVLLYQGQQARLDQNLQSNANDFLIEEDPYARQITGRVLTALEQELRGVSQEDLETRVPFIQSRFTQTIEQIITPEWQSYSMDLQLIKPDGTLLADYSTDLNSPNWVNVYDLERLSTAIDIERITKATNRPIVQLPQLENAEDYETFYRGWIPIFSPGSEDEDQVAWILCSVYKERPNFDKPIRAVLASLTYNDWKDSYLMLQYRNGNLERTLKKGVTGRYPKYNNLRPEEIRALEQDSVIYYTSTFESNTYRNLLFRTPDKGVIKATTLIPDIKTVLFGFFRFSFILLLAGLIIQTFRFLANVKKQTFLANTRRFEYRILDSFMLAALIFLGLLVATSHYAIRNQNEEIVRQELFDKLEELTELTERDDRFRSSINSNEVFSLGSITSPLDADITFYRQKQVVESTTPQIYQQHLVAGILPYPVYDNLFLDQRRETLISVKLAFQNLLIGYRSVLSPDNSPTAVISIPTFVYSPKYNQQLLETTSYLIVLYLLVFGIFILGTTFISKQLTRPLRYIQRGLNKISRGNLDTRIPVKSDDEIGALAQAYNEMVDRLKELQEELSIAEREAAWKEMAQQVAHEIKNPLTPMKLNVQHLERQLSSDSHDTEQLKRKIRKITANLIEQIKTLNNIASDFSKFSKPIEEEFTRVEVNQVLESVIDLYQHDNKIEICTELSEHTLSVHGVADELRRVFINLVKNSYEAMDGGGHLNVRSYQNRDSVFVEIEDDGEGIAEEDKSKIFVPNFSTKSSGTGLGLAICKKIIEAHDGSISFASIKGKGTTFIIKLPANST